LNKSVCERQTETPESTIDTPDHFDLEEPAFSMLWLYLDKLDCSILMVDLFEVASPAQRKRDSLKPIA